MKDVNKFDRVLKRYLANQYSTEDVLFLQQYFLEGDASIVANRISEILGEECATLQEAGNDVAAERVVRKLDQYIAGFTYVPARKFHLKTRWRVAAIALVSLSLGLTAYLFLFHWGNDSADKIALEERADGTMGIEGAKNVVPPDAKPYLRLLDGTVMKSFDEGEEVRLDGEGNLLSGERRSQTLKPGQDVAFVVPRGTSLKLKLPDGSTVMLNAASHLIYNTNFIAGNRKVRLDGEAFFQVVQKRRADRDGLEKFTIYTDKQSVEVHGTSFNIKAYRNEKVVKTALVTGQVDIVTTKDRVPLRVGMQSTNDGHNIQTKRFKESDVLGWMSNDFIFSNHDLEEVMQQIQRWYNVEYIFRDVECKNIKIGGSVSRSQNLYTVLNALSATGAIRLNYKQGFIEIYAK